MFKATTSTSTPSSQMQTAPKADELELVIPLNDTGSAGLGVSLKARVTVRTNGTRQDCGIFIKNVGSLPSVPASLSVAQPNTNVGSEEASIRGD